MRAVSPRNLRCSSQQVRPKSSLAAWQVHLHRASHHGDWSCIPGRLREAVRFFVPPLNGCSQIFQKQLFQCERRIDDLERAADTEQPLRERNPGLAFAAAGVGLVNSAEKPAMRPSEMSRSDIQALRGAVLDDGRMSEIFQIGRHLNGRGVSNQCDIVSTPATTNHRPAAMIPPNSRCRAAAYASSIQTAVDW